MRSAKLEEDRSREKCRAWELVKHGRFCSNLPIRARISVDKIVSVSSTPGVAPRVAVPTSSPSGITTAPRFFRLRFQTTTKAAIETANIINSATVTTATLKCIGSSSSVAFEALEMEATCIPGDVWALA